MAIDLKKNGDNHRIESNKRTNTEFFTRGRNIFRLLSKITIGFIAVCALVCVGVWIYKSFTKSKPPKPLSPEEISQIIQDKQDSLRIDLFDGFYMTPAIVSSKDSVLENLYGHTSKEEVIADYVSMLNGKYNIVNQYGIVMELPEVVNGIDSICLKNAPFIEYIDDNGLRRVVAIYKDELYFYLGQCGVIDNLPLFILVNKDNKYGIINSRGIIVKEFCNDKIFQNSYNGFTVKNDEKDTHYYANGKEVSTTSTTSAGNASSEIVLERYYDYEKGLYGYKNTAGKVIVSPKFKFCLWAISKNDICDVEMQDGSKGLIDATGKVFVIYQDIGTYRRDNLVKIKNNNKYGIYNYITRKEVVKTIYRDVNISGSSSNLFPVKNDNDRWGYVQSGGKIAIDFIFKDAQPFNHETKLAVVKDENGKCGYIDFDGKYKIQPQYYSASTMTPDGARVMKSSKEYGYIDKFGNLITSWYPYLGQKFVLDRNCVRNSDKLVGFVNRKNEIVIPYMFDAKIDPVFNEVSCLAKVSYKNIEWYINTNGAFCYPASSDLKPTDQDIQVQIIAAEERVEKEKAEREMKRNKDKNRR